MNPNCRPGRTQPMPRTIALLCLMCALGCAGSKEEVKPATAASSASKSLFERLGGLGAIEAVVDDFFGRVAADPALNAQFAVSHVPRTRQRLIELVCAATGGPCTYSGRDMKTTHTGMAITEAQFNALAGHLVATLDKFKVPEKEKGELLALISPMKPDIVEEP
jgi:hemoglobin